MLRRCVLFAMRYPCELDWYCDTGGLNIIIGGGDNGWDGGGDGRPIRPR